MAASITVDGAKIAELRMLSGWNQEETARMVGITRPGLHKIEKYGTTSPATLVKLARLLRVPPEELRPASRAVA